MKFDISLIMKSGISLMLSDIVLFATACIAGVINPATIFAALMSGFLFNHGLMLYKNRQTK